MKKVMKMPEPNQKFEISYLKALLDAKINPKKSKNSEITDRLISDYITKDAIDLIALENISEHKKIQDSITATMNEIYDLYETLHFILTAFHGFASEESEDTVRASNFKECIPKMIAHEMKTHPEMPQKQAIAVAYKKCKEMFNQDYVKIVKKPSKKKKSEDPKEQEKEIVATQILRDSRFSELVKKLQKKGVSNPRALAAWIGRKKYGKEGFAKLSAKGRRKK